MSDLHQEITNVSVGSAAPSPAGSGAAGGEGFGAERVRAEWAEVEVTLTDLDPELEQLFDGFLEPLDPSGAEIVRVIDFIVMLPAHEEQIPESVPLTDCERCVGSGPIVFECPDVCDLDRDPIFSSAALDQYRFGTIREVAVPPAQDKEGLALAGCVRPLGAHDYSLIDRRRCGGRTVPRGCDIPGRAAGRGVSWAGSGVVGAERAGTPSSCAPSRICPGVIEDNQPPPVVRSKQDTGRRGVAL